jgi:OOP family OmpA-OmpF porin
MKKLNKVALLFAVAAMAGGAVAQTRATAADGGNRVDNWVNGDATLVWMNGTREYCWRDANWTPATAAKGCDGALVVQAPAPAPVAVPAPPPPPPPPPAPQPPPATNGT